MSRKILCTFSGDRYHLTTKRIVEDAPRLGCDEVWVFDDVWLMKQAHHVAVTKWAFDHPKRRGVNWFCFKFFTILKALERCTDGDLLGFVDADTWPIADMTPLYDLAEKDGIALFAACGHKQSRWSKRDTQILCGCDTPEYRNKQAGCARFMFFKKSERTLGNGIPTVNSFLEQCLRITCDPRANTFDKSVLAPEYTDDFTEARCEQAIMTNIAHSHGITLHRECDQWGNGFEKDFPHDTYPQIFESTGVYSYAPGPRKPGSAFANIKD